MLKLIGLFFSVLIVALAFFYSRSNPIQGPIRVSDQQVEKKRSDDLRILAVQRLEINGHEVSDCIVHVDLSAKCTPRQEVEQVKQR